MSALFVAFEDFIPSHEVEHSSPHTIDFFPAKNLGFEAECLRLLHAPPEAGNGC